MSHKVPEYSKSTKRTYVTAANVLCLCKPKLLFCSNIQKIQRIPSFLSSHLFIASWFLYKAKHVSSKKGSVQHHVTHTTSISIFYVGQYLTHCHFHFGLSFSYLDYVSFLKVPVDVTTEVFLSQSSNAESKYEKLNS